MNLIIASKFDANDFYQKVGVVRLSKTGSGRVSKKLQGSHYSELARQAARQFAYCPAMAHADFEIGGEMIRIIRY